jgi:hypothetical protein
MAVQISFIGIWNPWIFNWKLDVEHDIIISMRFGWQKEGETESRSRKWWLWLIKSLQCDKIQNECQNDSISQTLHMNHYLFLSITVGHHLTLESLVWDTWLRDSYSQKPWALISYPSHYLHNVSFSLFFVWDGNISHCYSSSLWGAK